MQLRNCAIIESMSVWYCIPSARSPEEAEPVLKRWRAQGYKIALWRDWSLESKPMPDWIEHVSYVQEYPGYAKAVNALISGVLKLHDPEADWFVTGGDDITPDPTKRAEEIARECSEYFAAKDRVRFAYESLKTEGPPSDAELAEFVIAGKLRDQTERLQRDSRATFGVMQPTGDRFGESPNDPNPAMRGAYIDRVAGSPWMGREWCKRINQGRGPLWPEYFHMGADEELQAIATKLGVLWQRPELLHHHAHWGRPREGERMAPSERMPEFLKRANSGEEWAAYKNLFAERKAAGFPGAEPL